jgi:omega-6 fatty acid desaturase (delta-12 desaturase)
MLLPDCSGRAGFLWIQENVNPALWRNVMISNASSAEYKPAMPDWYEATAVYMQPNLRKAAWQCINTFIPYLAMWALMLYAVYQGYSYWMILALAVLAAALLVRIFVFFHDCCHNSFFASSRANTVLGYITGILTFTPFADWRRTHGMHHSSAGDLDRRGVGDVWTLTLEEYREAPGWKRLAYRFFRNPLFLLGPVSVVLVLVIQRFPSAGARKKQIYSVLLTNLAILAVIGLARASIGLKAYVVIQLPILLIAWAVGMWLFYIQHQFEGVYWARHEKVDKLLVAMKGSSYYKLPRILQWFTGNIGLHHIHHLRPRIPNYNLQQCYDDSPSLQVVNPLTIRASLKALRMNLWDEDQQNLVSFRSVT